MKQYLKEFVHSVVVHPIMMFLPKSYRKSFHDWNADWTFKERCDELYHEGRKDVDDFPIDVTIKKVN